MAQWPAYRKQLAEVIRRCIAHETATERLLDTSVVWRSACAELSVGAEFDAFVHETALASESAFVDFLARQPMSIEYFALPFLRATAYMALQSLVRPTH